jgi:hypothetical protein
MAGAADLIVLLPKSVTVLPETKTPVGYQSPAQKSFEGQVSAIGHYYFVYKSLEQFKEKMKPYLEITGLEIKP